MQLGIVIPIKYKDKVIDVAFRVPLADARSAKDNLMIAFKGKISGTEILRDYWHIEPKRQAPYDVLNTIAGVPFDIAEMALYDFLTGEIISKNFTAGRALKD